MRLSDFRANGRFGSSYAARVSFGSKADTAPMSQMGWKASIQAMFELSEPSALVKSPKPGLTFGCGFQNGPLHRLSAIGDQFSARSLAPLLPNCHLGPTRFRSKPAITNVMERRCTGDCASFRGALQIKLELGRHVISNRKKGADAYDIRPSFHRAEAQAV